LGWHKSAQNQHCKFWTRTYLKNNWLALGRPTLSDIAGYPYAALAGEGEVELEPYKNLTKWFDRICALPGYISMPGLPEA
jgi:glutathione S-transferase